MFIFIKKLFVKLEKTVHDNEAETLFCETPVLNNPEAYLLTHNWFNTSMVSIFSDLNKAQFYRKPYTHSPHHEIEILISFNF